MFYSLLVEHEECEVFNGHYMDLSHACGEYNIVQMILVNV